MRLRTVTAGYLTVLGMAAAPVAAQARAAGDLDPLGRVLAKVKAEVSDPQGFARPISGLAILVVTENGDRQQIVTDDAGIATAWLEPASYRFVTPTPVSWGGATYSWDITVPIRPGTAAIIFSPTNAKPVATGTERSEPQPPIVEQVPGDPGRVRVFVDCQTGGCDLDYFRTEIPFVDYMRDRSDASVHILITAQPTGGGGRSYTVNFIGRRELAGMADTMRYDSPQTATDDEKRSDIAAAMKLGLVRYVVRTPEGARLRLSYKPATRTAASTASRARDRWNLWVFRTTASGSFEGEKSQRSASLRGTTSANRTSEDWKFRLGFNGGYNESKYTFSDGSKYSDYTHSYGANHLLVRSLGRHWAIGERASLSSSTFLNQKLFLRFAPTIEYNFFPYSEATRRRLTVAYAVGVNSFTYEDTTIFEKLKEVRPNQSLIWALDFKQPWGAASLSLEWAALLDDFSKQHTTLYNELDLRLFKGLSLNTYAGVSVLRDQLYLAKGKLSDEAILLRRRQLASKYSYYGGVGLSYTFGSIFNNVVNPRFDGIR